MTPSNASFSRQLDLFRGFAALLMIVNHAGYAWLTWADSLSGPWGAAVFLGSAAPALFFFATGVGMGMNPLGREGLRSLLTKMLLLGLADAFLHWSSGHIWGLDFFAFCALSMGAVACVDASPRPRLSAALGIAGILTLRYGLVPLVTPLLDAHPWIGFVTGVGGMAQVSYPLGPWLAAPLAGFLLGRTSLPGEKPPSPAILLACGAGLVATSALMAARGSVVHRWGTMSLAYFAFAAGFVVLTWTLAGALQARLSERVRRALSTRGIASLLIVPIHYLLIHLGEAFGGVPWHPAVWAAAVALFALSVLAVSQVLAAALAKLPATARARAGVTAALLLSTGLCAWTALTQAPLPRAVAACLAQVVVAAQLSSLTLTKARLPRSA